jgi:hypothetical protein
VNPAREVPGDGPLLGCECANYFAHLVRAIWRYPRPVATIGTLTLRLMTAREGWM